MDDTQSLTFEPGENKAFDLTPKQYAFCREYLVDFNATAAARRAGYRGSNATLRAAGYRNLHKPAVIKALKEIFTQAGITPEEVAYRLTRQARASMASFLSLDPDGFLTFDFEKALQSGDLDLIERLKFNHTRRPDGTVHQQVELKLHSAQRALKLIGQTFQMWQGYDWNSGSQEPELLMDVDARLRLIAKVAEEDHFRLQRARERLARNQPINWEEDLAAPREALALNSPTPQDP